MEKQIEIRKYLEIEKNVHRYLIMFIETETAIEISYENLMIFLTNLKIQENKHELKSLLHLLLNVSNNHHRGSNFFKKIEQVINSFKVEIQNYFTNNEIFNIFITNKRILLYLFEEKIITPEISMVYSISDDVYQSQFYHFYFFPEFQHFFSQQQIQKFFESNIKFDEINEMIKKDAQSFEEKRRIGENDSYLAYLIRNDLIKEFISYVTEKNIPLSATIEPSIFETNSFLMNNSNQTLLEYSAFFGSINIFRYLFSQKTDISPSIWLYLIHGQNNELLEPLKTNQPNLSLNYIENCLIESIKCHHIEIALHLKNGLLQNQPKSNFDIMPFYVQYYNYALFPDDLAVENNFLFYLCQYDYFTIVEFLLNNMNLNVNFRNIFNTDFLNIIASQ